MNIRHHLRLLTGVFLTALAIVAGVGALNSAVIRGKMKHLTQQVMPLQAELGRLLQTIERLDGTLNRFPTVTDQDALADITKRTKTDLATVQALVDRLTTLNADLEPTLVQNLRAACDTMINATQDRLSASIRVTDAIRLVQERISGVQAQCHVLEELMTTLRSEAKQALDSSRVGSEAANARIKELRIAREKLVESRSLIIQVGTIENRYRLSSLKDRLKATVDAIRDQARATLTTDSELTTVIDATEKGFLDDQDGLLAWRAKVLSEPTNPELRKQADARSKQLLNGIDGGLGHLGEAIDPQELTVLQANQRINAAIASMAIVDTIDHATNEAMVVVQTLGGDAWHLATTEDDATLATIRTSCKQRIVALNQQFTVVDEGLTKLNRTADRPIVAKIQAAIPAMEQALLGDQGIAVDKANAIAAHRRQTTSTTSMTACITTTTANANQHVLQSSTEQQASIESIDRSTLIAGVVVIAMGLIAILVGLTVSRKATRVILATETRELERASELSSLLDAVTTNTSSLTEASQELTTASEHLANQANQTNQRAGLISTTSTQVSNGVGSVASSAQEMGASIREISTNTGEAARIAGEAVTLASAAADTMGKLGASSTHIGEIIKVIASIAEQTNLLALNATIEAARAGEYGKGFAVVAHEVKELARQTATASDDITTRIDAIRGDSTSAIQAIEQIAAVIKRISDIQTGIAGAVEEQTATTSTMTGQLTTAASGCQDIATGITGLSGTLSTTAQEAAHMRELATRLADMANTLNRLCTRKRD